jgi:hypothetical protein
MADRWQDFRLLPPPGDGEAEEDGVMVIPWAVARPCRRRRMVRCCEDRDRGYGWYIWYLEGYEYYSISVRKF